MKKVAFHNLGCKVNSYETAHMEELFKQKGYEIASFNDVADIYIVNTCSVTNIADRKSRQMLHRAKKKNQEAVVVACGCYAQTKTEEAQLDPSIDIVVGNNKKNNIVDIVEQYMNDNETNMTQVIDINNTDEYEDMDYATVTEHTRAHIKIQDGCNNFCSYCIIPYARGRVRSRSIDSVIKEAIELVQLGYKEIVITGIEVSSYKDGDKTLQDLIVMLDQIKGLERLRLSSLNPDIITEDFVKTISETRTLCPHFHLSLQSGCDKILKGMNRHYTTAEYLEKCELLRKYFDDPAITTDIIVGFPGEDDQDFATTMEFVKKVRFSMLHVFKYSRRDGTVAASMDNQVDESVKSARSEQLIALGKQLQNEYEMQYVGQPLEVLFEEQKKDGRLVGHTRNYLTVSAETSENWINSIKCVTAVKLENDELMA